MPNQIETKGTKILIKNLIAKGRKVEKSDNKTFDLKVDGIYAEIKTKGKCYNKLGFLSFTDKQYREIVSGNFVIFLVCNVNTSNKVEIFEFNSKSLKNIVPKKYTSHEYNKPIIDKILGYENTR